MKRPAARPPKKCKLSNTTKSDGQRLHFLQNNPKSGSSAGERYEKYKAARTFKEAKELGASPRDLRHDFQRGYLTILKVGARSSAAAPVSTIRVACVGDSNTQSRGYPLQLQRLLNTKRAPHSYQVRSFGVSGSTAAATATKKCYRRTQTCRKAIAFRAHTYTVMLGTNDAWHRNGEPQKVAGGLKLLMQKLRHAAQAARADSAVDEESLPPPLLLVMPPGAKPGRLCDNLREIVKPAISSLAIKEGVDLVALNLHQTNAYRDDLVHLSSMGAAVVAKAVASQLKMHS